MSSTLLLQANAPPKSLKQLFLPPVGDKCTRCSQRVYQVEKVGPVNEVVFHKQCFKCAECGHHLSLKTYFTNQMDFSDKEIYCGTHTPKTSAHGYSGNYAQRQGRRGTHNDQIRGTGEHAPKIGSDAMHIRGAISAQNDYRRKYITKYDKHHFPAYLVNKTKEKLYKYQEELEERQRVEEDRMMAEFQDERKHEAENIEKEINDEWEVQLKDLMSKHETVRGDKKDKDQFKSTERYEEEMAELKKTMTLKTMRKKQAASVKLQSKAQQQTATLVKKHSQQMLELLQTKQDELKQELEDEIKSTSSGIESENQQEIIEEALTAISLPTEIPDAHPPQLRKRDLYHDPSVFKELDEDVFKVAEAEQGSFTELVRQLTAHCLSDLQKARAIFRWITVKDLNVMEFEDSVKQDTPLGLLRGIKFGTETYHTLFMRLCSYAGLACQEVRGHSKSVGYEPGMKIHPDTFQNSWNLVLILGDWWPVQCNWGARHLVLNKDLKPNDMQRTSENIRYQYDEHYFLTDPDEFIQEFWAKDPAWQLLERPITLEEFETLPFVRSVFFHHDLEFSEPPPLKAVLNTDSKGGMDVRLNVSDEEGHELVLHYQLRFADRERRNDVAYMDAKLERFVFQTVGDGWVLFSVHVPVPGSYFLEIFCSRIEEGNKIGEDPNAAIQPFKLKCATKFKIVCEELSGKMHPLPACASGEWGPSKGKRHFDLVAQSHPVGVINVTNDIDIRFQVPRPLVFLCKLRHNEFDEAALTKFVTQNVVNGLLTIRVSPPKVGQYGLDIYARPEEASNVHTMAHATKYLVNCVSVANPVELPVAVNGKSASAAAVGGGGLMGGTLPPGSTLPKTGTLPPAGVTFLQKNSSSPVPPAQQPAVGTPSEAIGPCPAFGELGLKTLSHKEPAIEKVDKNGSVTVEIGAPDSVCLTHLLVREPDEEWHNKVTVKKGSKKYKFTVDLPKPGRYRLSLLAGRKDEPQNKMAVVYRYLIIYESSEKKKGKKT